MDPQPDAHVAIDSASGHDRPPQREFIEVASLHDMPGPATSAPVSTANDAWTLWGDPDR